ncbi:MAG: Lrp/AsnC family transcriptional regulator [Nanoarchaeota archaeon]|nr:Lrp/AsnC family transcriptional regulator [Nanoarchaeota archaeon]
MISEKDLNILKLLRKNARSTITAISKSTGIPISTVFDRIRKQENGVISKHTAIVDFEELGFGKGCIFAIGVTLSDSEAMKNWLQAHPGLNSLYRLDYRFDFLAEMIFKNDEEQDAFVEQTNKRFPILEICKFPVQKVIQKEMFLSSMI